MKKLLKRTVKNAFHDVEMQMIMLMGWLPIALGIMVIYFGIEIQLPFYMLIGIMIMATTPAIASGTLFKVYRDTKYELETEKEILREFIMINKEKS